MQLNRRSTTLLLLIPMIVGLLMSSTIVPASNMNTSLSDDSETGAVYDTTNNTDESVQSNGFTISAEPLEGIINPIDIKQSGYQTTDAKRGRTDTGTNTISNIPIDDTNGWFVNSTSIDVWNLQRLYGVNGTFEDGVDPWTNYSIDGGSNTQIVSYNSTEEYIECRNIGSYYSHPIDGVSYTHSQGTEIGFTQVVNNTPGVQDFRMEFDFRYATGPLDPQDDDPLGGDIGVFWELDAAGWYEGWYSVMNTRSSHDAWYSISHVFNVDAVYSEFTITIGLYIAGGDVEVFNNTDYDDDPLGEYDGLENMQNVTVQLDNVEFTSIASPEEDSVELTFHAGAFSTPISNSGTATISNPSFWTTDPLQIEITSNTSVVFSYDATSLYHRYINSSWTTDLSKTGVQYTVTAGQSPDMFLYTYITPSTEYNDLTIDVLYPKDWETATILDPLSSDVTGLCTVSPGRIHIPNSEMSRSGWWEMNLQSPNYARNISVQVQDQSNGKWSENSLFRPGNTTRTQVEIGTVGGSPTDGSPVNISCVLPNATSWATDSITTMINGFVNSSSWILGGANTSAGQWEVTVVWTNGTEIAYDYVVFDMYHTASITPREALIVTDTGLLITNMVYYVDEDTSEYITDASATVVANWSSTIITFQPNPIHNWYEADFNTSFVGGGIFTIIVNASIPYFDNVSCLFVIESTFTTSISLPDVGAGAEEIGRNEKYKLNISYLLTNGTGIDNAQIGFSYSGPSLGLSNSSPTYLGSGTYTLEITGLFSGEYTVSITASKNFHYSKSDYFTLIVGETGTDFVSLNGTADLVPFGSTYHLVVQYTNSTGGELVGADVQVTQVTPSTGLTVIPGVDTPIVDEGSGFYSVDFTPTVSGAYTIVLKANITNHVTAYVTFTLLVTDVSTTLTPHTSSATIIIDQDFTLQLSYEDDSLIGIDGATITLIDAPSGIAYVVNPLGGGLYNMTLTPSVTLPTSFQLSFKASLTNYQNASTTFSLLVQNIPTELVVIVGDSSGTIDITESYNVTVSYIRLDTNANISLADIEISATPSVGLTPWWQYAGDVYQLGFTADRIGIWQISVSANSTKFATATMILELEVLALDTIFISLNGTVDEVGYGLTYTLVLNYTSILGTGLFDSWVNVTEVDPVVGLTLGSTIDEGGGIYSILLTPTIADTYTLTIRANITNHVTRYLTFSLLVVDTPTVLIPDSSGATISVDQNYTLQLTFQDTLANPIDGATITLVDVPSDLAFVWIPIGGGVYNVTLTPSVTESKSFQLSFRASRVNYQTSSTAFTLFVQIIPTTLQVINGSQTETLSILDSYIVTLAYLRTDIGENITSADFAISTTPTTGFTADIIAIDGAYQLTFQATSVGIWQLVVTANRTYFVSAIIQIELEILPIDTTITGLNGTADLVSYGDSYKISLKYTNSSGLGIIDANMSITEVTPSIGIIYSDYSTDADGIYSIILTPTTTETFSIVFRINITNHVTQYFSFALVATPIQTVLIAEESGATISLDQEHTVQVEYRDALDNPVLGAVISIPDIPDELSYSFVEIGGGIYNVTLTPSVITTTTFQISFSASLENYQNSTTVFSLLIQVIPTELVILEGEAAESILFGDEYQLIVAYVRTDNNENISLADFQVYTSPGEGLVPTITQTGEVYVLTFTVDSIGVWEITITANKTNHITSRLTLELEVSPIDTSLNDITLLEALVFGRTYNFTFTYAMNGGTTVDNASVTISGSATTWAVVTEDDSGHYTVSLTTEDVGSFEVSLAFSRDGFLSRETVLEFDVREASISVIDIQGLSGLEGSLNTLSVRLVDSETGDPISGASVTFQIIQNLVPGSTDRFVESDTVEGLYSASYIMPAADLEVKMRIYIELDNYQLEDDSEYLEADATPTISEFTALTRTVTQYSPLILLAIIVVSGYAGRRSYRRRKRKENIQALAIKRRFDDVRNMLGVVVLHKDSGIPVYSRMLKGGFDDSLISAFITAISQFRSEFDVSQKEWMIVPISDIISAIRTQNLVCAFITSGNPSKTQKERMIRFAKAVGLMFDSDYEEAPVLSIDEEAEDRFDDLFDEMLDMHLHHKHMIVDSKKLPRGPRCLNRTISELEAAEGFGLEEMAEKIAACGLEEAHVYKIIMDAIERNDLVQIEEEESEEDSPAPSGMDEVIEVLPEPITIEPETIEAPDSSSTPSKGEDDEKDRFIGDVEALLSSEKDDDDSDNGNPERLDVS